MGLTQITTGGVDDNINIDSNTLKVDGTNNRVGIGTASPASKMHLSGGAENVLLQTTNSTGDAFFGIRNGSYGLLGTGDTYIYTNDGDIALIADGASDVIKFAAGGNSERMRIDSSGNVGIGTSSADRLLHLAGADTAIIRLENTDTSLTADQIIGGLEFEKLDGSGAGVGVVGGLRMYSEGAVGESAYLTLSTASSSTNDAEALRIDSSGRLLVKTTTSANAKTYADDLVIGSVSGDNGMTIVSGTGGAGSIHFSDGANSGDNASRGLVQYDHTTNSLRFWTNSSERMRIDSSGRLLIGASSNVGSSSVLQVREDSFGRNFEIFRSYDSANTPARIRFSNSRGTSASPTIVVNGDDLGEIRFNGHDGTNYDTPAAAILGVVDGTPGENDMPGRLEFHTTSDGGSSTTERMRIDSSGNIGIGTTTPSQSWTSQTAKTQQLRGSSGQITVFRVNEAGGSGGDLQLVSSASAEAAVYNFANGSLRFGTNATERMRILPHGSIRASTARTDSDYAQNTSDYWHLFHHHLNDNAALIIEHSGNSSPYGLAIDFSDASPDNNTNYFINCFDSSAVRLKVFSDGDVDNHDNSYSGFSDVKLKQDIVDAGSQWDDIKDLRVRKFKFKSDVAAYGDEAKTLIGVVAQETELVSPGLVKESPDKDKQGNDLGTTTKSVRYSVLYMKAVKALQEAMDRIETLEAKVAALEAAE